MKLNQMDDLSAGAAGFYFGLIGAGLSLIGILLSAYSLVDGEKSVWLGLSGWMAAILLAVTLTKLVMNLVKINAELSDSLSYSQKQEALLSEKNDRLTETNAKLIDIDAYIASTAMKKAIPRREKSAGAATATKQTNNDSNEEA